MNPPVARRRAAARWRSRARRFPAYAPVAVPRDRLGGWLRGIALAALAWTAQAAAAEPVAVPGIVEPLHEARLSPSVGGTIAAILAPEGTRVKKDDPLIELDRDIEELEVLRRRLAWESKAEVEAAAARVATSSNDVEATRKLFDSTKSVSREELEKKELELKIARAEHARLTAAEEREQLECRMAEAQLARRTIRAPFEGVVTDVYVDLGEMCDPQRQQAVVRLVQSDQCRFVANIDAALARPLREGQEVRLELGEQGGPAVSRGGRVDFISPVVDPASGLRKVKVLFENRDDPVTPGISGRLLLDRRL